MLFHQYTTPRLELIAATRELIRAELRSAHLLAALLKAEVASDWPPGQYDRTAMEFLRDCLEQNGEEAVGWYGWYALLRNAPSNPAVLVAAGGYYGPPSENGMVEIGYSVTAPHQRQGYATEIVTALNSMAFTDTRVHNILAHTNQTNHASITVLKRTGFIQTRCVDFEGTLRFELSRDRFHSLANTPGHCCP